MSDYRCDRCGESIAGKFIEADIEPRFLGVADDATLLGYAETQHLLKTGCGGSLVRVPPPRRGVAGWAYRPSADQYERSDGVVVSRAYVSLHGFPR